MLFETPIFGDMRPYGPLRIRRDRALTDNILLAAVWDGIRGRDLISNRLLLTGTEPNPTTSATAGLVGPAGKTTATSQFWHWGAEGGAGVRLPTNRCTVAMLRRRADTTDRDAAFFGSSNAGNSTRLMLSTFADNTVKWDFGGVAGANRITATFAGNITTNLEAWVAVAGVRGSALYRNGLRLAAQTTEITRTTSTAVMQVPGAANASTAGDPQEVYLFLLLEQEWTPTQVMEWTVAPWSIFQPPRRLIGRRAATATGHGALLAGYRNQLIIA